jgi:hypothetical protein
VALEEEVEEALRPEYERKLEQDLAGILPPVLLTYDEAKRQLDQWTGKEKG